MSVYTIYYVYGCFSYLPTTDLTVFGFSHCCPGTWPPLHTTIHRRRPSGRCARGSAGARHGPVIGGDARVLWCGGARAFRQGASQRCNAAETRVFRRACAWCVRAGITVCTGCCEEHIRRGGATGI